MTCKRRRQWQSLLVLAAMAGAGLPVATGAAFIAHRVFHVPLSTWSATALCFIASAVSTLVANGVRAARHRARPVRAGVERVV